MTTDAATVVDGFLAAICDNDLERALGYCAADIEYDNVPIGPVVGHDGVRQILGPLLAGASRVEWIIHHQLASGDVVMNTRLDRFEIGEGWLELPVAGVFEVSDGKITLWRDYFDLGTFQSQFTGSA